MNLLQNEAKNNIKKPKNKTTQYLKYQKICKS
jgi:hypothetical protein